MWCEKEFTHHVSWEITIIIVNLPIDIWLNFSKCDWFFHFMIFKKIPNVCQVKNQSRNEEIYWNPREKSRNNQTFVVSVIIWADSIWITRFMPNGMIFAISVQRFFICDSLKFRKNHYNITLLCYDTCSKNHLQQNSQWSR